MPKGNLYKQDGWIGWFKNEMKRFYFSFMAHWHSVQIHKSVRFSEKQKYHFRELIRYNIKRDKVGVIKMK